jgi:hypothetical protein
MYTWTAILAAAFTAALIALVTSLTAAAPARADDGGCAWTVRSDPDRVNVAYPDESATYWTTQWVAAPGTELRISGTYPHARYFSFHVYEGGVPIDHLYDAEIDPDHGVNTFRPGADRRDPGHYALRVSPDPKPEHPAPNTLYTGRGVYAGEPAPVVTIIYRVYLGEGNLAGSVGLPNLEYRAGDTGLNRPAVCPDSTGASEGGLNETIKGESLPSYPQPSGQAPDWTVARSGGGTNPFFPNFDVTYLALSVYRDRGDVVAFRAKAPTFVAARGSQTFASAQLRYWSICVNEQASNRYVDCTPDQDAKIDADGYMSFVISDAAHKPAQLDPQDNWLPAGPYPDVFVLYRHMLPDPGFAFAAQRVPTDGTPKQALGPYYPDTRVCMTSQFDTGRCGLAAPAVAKPASPAKPGPKPKPKRRATCKKRTGTHQRQKSCRRHPRRRRVS